MSQETLQVFFNQPLSVEDSHVRMSVVRGNEKGFREVEQDCGSNFCELSKNCNPLGLLERMLKDLLPKDSTKCFVVWKTRDTPAKRTVFQLARLVRRTRERESLHYCPQ